MNVSAAGGPSVRERPTGGDVHRVGADLRALRTELAARIVGQEAVITEVLAALLVEGHCLVVGVPGLAKTLLVSSIGELLGLEFRRIQFTPDLMPSDITGTSVIAERDGTRDYQFLRGPIFANLILADEINRTPPKTQAALMEAMEERQVSASGRRHRLDRPFFVLATQNPIEQRGTYPLPISQLDRFLFNVLIDYPERDEEFDVLVRTTSEYRAKPSRCFERDDVVRWIETGRTVRTPEPVVQYAAALARATRPEDASSPPTLRSKLTAGAGPRAAQALIAGARAIALMDGRGEARTDDVRTIALPTLRHRVLLSYHSSAEGLSPDDLVRQVIAHVDGGGDGGAR